MISIWVLVEDSFIFYKAAAYALTSAYDSAVSGWLAGEAAGHQMLRHNLVTRTSQGRTYTVTQRAIGLQPFGIAGYRASSQEDHSL